MNKNHAIILAAGKGTRMGIDSPKCAYPFCGKPMINHIIDNCNSAGIDDIVVIVGYKAEELIKLLPDGVKYAVQNEQLGTGHATKCAKELLYNEDGLTLIFPGDMPLVNDVIINGLINKHYEDKNDLTFVTVVLEDPKQYGRIYRENGKVKKIVEFKDCNEEQKLIKETNVGLYAINNKLLFESLDKISNNNKANEYYLTDIIEIMGKDYKVDTYIVKNDCHCIGVNDIPSLKKLEEEYLKELANK